MQAPPTGVEAQMQWIVDRASISDLLIHVATSSDRNDTQAVAACFAPEGVIVTPYRDMPRDEIAAAVEQILRPFEATHHQLGNISIDLDDDVATTHHYVIATHVPKADDPAGHADIGGVYDCVLRRTQDGWRITRLHLQFVFAGGLPFEPGS